MQYLYAALIGLFGGMLSGLFGIGGGVVMVPALVMLMGVDIKKAIGTSLLVIVPTALVGAFRHYTLGNVDWKIGLSLVPMALVGSWTGAWLTATQLSAGNIRKLFGGFLILVGIRLMVGK